MKKIVSILFCGILIVSGCSAAKNQESNKINLVAQGKAEALEKNYTHPNLGFSVSLPKDWELFYETELVAQFSTPYKEPTDDGKPGSFVIPDSVINAEKLSKNQKLDDIVQLHLDAYLNDDNYNYNYEKTAGTWHGLPAILIIDTFSEKTESLNVKKSINLSVKSGDTVYTLSFLTTSSSLNKYMPTVYAFFESLKLQNN